MNKKLLREILRNETGEMSKTDIEKDGEHYEWAKYIKQAAKEIERRTKGKLKFKEMRPFDKYQGPYAIVTLNGNNTKLWSSEDDKFFIEKLAFTGSVKDISDYINDMDKLDKTPDSHWTN